VGQLLLFNVHTDVLAAAVCLRQNLVFAKIAMQIDALRNQGLAFSHAAFRRAQERPAAQQYRPE